MPLHDFICKRCEITFEDVSTYSDALRTVEPVNCPQCEAPCGIIWLKAPGVAGDENLTKEEKVAAALRLGIGADGRMTVPQTRSDMKKIRAAFGDFRVGEKELLTRDRPGGDSRSTAEKEASKGETIDFIRQRRAMRRAGNLPRARVDREVESIQKSQAVNPNRILAGKSQKAGAQ